MTGSLFSCGQIDEAMTLIIGFQHGTSLLCAQLELIVFDQHLIHGWLGSINSTDRRWHGDLQLQKDIRALTKHSSDNCLIANLSTGYALPDGQRAQEIWEPVNLGWSQKLCLFIINVESKHLKQSQGKLGEKARLIAEKQMKDKERDDLYQQNQYKLLINDSFLLPQQLSSSDRKSEKRRDKYGGRGRDGLILSSYIPLSLSCPTSLINLFGE